MGSGRGYGDDSTGRSDNYGDSTSRSDNYGTSGGLGSDDTYGSSGVSGGRSSGVCNAHSYFDTCC